MMTETELAITSTAGESPIISVWNVKNGTLLSTYRNGGICSKRGLSVSDYYVIAAENEKPLLHCWQINNEQKMAVRLWCGGKITTIDLSPDKTHLAVGVEQNLHLYQMSTGKLLSIGARHFQPLTVAKFNEDGTIIACGGRDSLVTIWNITSLIEKNRCSNPMFLFSEHSLPITDVAFTCGILRGRIISVSLDKTCKVHDFLNGSLMQTLIFEVSLTSINVIATERILFIGNDEGGIYRINLSKLFLKPTPLVLHERKPTIFGRHNKAITSLSSSVDCSTLLSASNDETVKVWHISSGQCLRTIFQKGPVINAKFFFSSRMFFDQNFTPLFRPKNLIHSPDNITDSFCEIITDDDLEIADTLKVNISTQADVSQEIIKVKNVNREMYKFIIGKIFGRKIKSNIKEHNDVTNISRSKNIKKKFKKSGKINLGLMSG